MPELPEIQALAERLEAALGGHELTRIDVLQFSALKTVDPSPLDLHGRSLSSIGRRGKFLIFDFESERLLLHLSQGGRIDVESQPKSTKPKGALFRMRFSAAPAVFVKEFGTERK